MEQAFRLLTPLWSRVWGLGSRVSKLAMQVLCEVGTDSGQQGGLSAG